MSTDNVADAGDTILTTRSAAAQSPLNPGASYSATQNTSIATGTTPGDYFLVFVTDATSVQQETDETNNTRALAFRVQAVDLTVADAVTPSQLMAHAGLEGG